MFDEPAESPADRLLDPASRARERAEESRIHAQLAAVFEGPRKLGAQLRPLDATLAREIQRTMGRLEKSRTPDSPILPPAVSADAAALLDMPHARDLARNDYYVYRRPGEAMIVRWLEADEVEVFYERLQAHFDAAIEGIRDDERAALGWKQDPAAAAYLKALDAIQVKMADWYLRDAIRKHGIYVLSTQAADEINITYLADYVMGVAVEDIVGSASAPPVEPAEGDLAWFFKLFALRGVKDGIEQMCFFAYLQKTDEGW